MRRRPLNKRFGQKTLDEIKVTTLRESEWPDGVPIMLYHWSDRPYRSKQIDVCAVVVIWKSSMHICRGEDDSMSYWWPEFSGSGDISHLLWKEEGFDSQEEMDEWFRALVKKGGSINRWFHRFRRVKDGEEFA